MKKRTFLAYCVLASTLIAQPCFAVDLLMAYNQALQSDPQFKTAEGQWLATAQLNPMSRALLFPVITGPAGTARSHVDEMNGQRSTKFYQTTKQYGLNLSQVLFDYKAWAGLRNADAQVKSGRATYTAAAQNLMLRVATGYLAVLQAYDEWLATQAQKRSLAQQLQQTKAQYKVGLIAVTGMEQVKASYDATVAEEITNKNLISNKLEELRAITGTFYTQMLGVTADLPLTPPQPANINAWVDTAAKQNYTLQAANFAMVAARENIGIQRAGHFPSVSASGGYGYTNESNALTGSSASGPQPTDNRTASIGLSVNVPIYQGGLVLAETRQAAAQYAAASAQLEQTFRITLTQAREAYLGVMSGMSKLTADRQAIISNQASLDSTKAGYTAGNNTIVDVLQQQSSLYAAQTSYASDQYSYLLSILNLKQAAGTLSPQDLAEINSWLTRNVDLAAYDFNATQPAAAAVIAAPLASASPAKNHPKSHHKGKSKQPA